MSECELEFCTHHLVHKAARLILDELESYKYDTAFLSAGALPSRELVERKAALSSVIEDFDATVDLINVTDDFLTLVKRIIPGEDVQ